MTASSFWHIFPYCFWPAAFLLAGGVLKESPTPGNVGTNSRFGKRHLIIQPSSSDVLALESETVGSCLVVKLEGIEWRSHLTPGKRVFLDWK